MSSHSLSKNADLAENQSIGTLLRQLRNASKLPLRRVAAAADMDTAHLSKIELGQRLPTEKQTAALAAFFAIPVEELQAKRIAERFLQEHRTSTGAARAASLIKEAVGPDHTAKERHAKNL